MLHTEKTPFSMNIMDKATFRCVPEAGSARNVAELSGNQAQFADFIELARYLYDVSAREGICGWCAVPTVIRKEWSERG